MQYIVATVAMPDEVFDAYDEACEWVKSMRRNGIDAVIVTSDDAWAYWSVSESGIDKRPHVVSSRSADEALMVARAFTNNYKLDTVQRH